MVYARTDRSTEKEVIMLKVTGSMEPVETELTVALFIIIVSIRLSLKNTHLCSEAWIAKK